MRNANDTDIWKIVNAVPKTKDRKMLYYYDQRFIIFEMTTELGKKSHLNNKTEGIISKSHSIYKYLGDNCDSINLHLFEIPFKWQNHHEEFIYLFKEIE